MPFDQDFDAVHDRALRERLSGSWGPLAATQARDLPPLAFRLPDGRSYTYTCICSPESESKTIELGRGADAATVVELCESDWLGLWDSTETVMGLVMSQRARVSTGEVSDFIRWEPALRVLYEELAPFDPSAPVVDSQGRELDPTTAFHPDDDPLEMAEFLRTTGYIVVREVVPTSEVQDLVEIAKRARARATEADGHSWWSDLEDGRRIPCRVLDGGRDPRIRSLPSDPRLLRVVGLSDYALEPTQTDYVSILYKQAGVVFDGKADQPWHRDCGLGGHKLMCPLMNGSLFLNAANRESGELRFLPGSWRTAGCLIDDPGFELGVAIEAGPGDFSLHYGDGLHTGPPPTSPGGPYRMSIVFEYGLAGRATDQSQEHYDQLMQQTDARALRSD